MPPRSRFTILRSVSGESLVKLAEPYFKAAEAYLSTPVATATEPLGGETTVVTLDRALAREGRFPALDRERSWTMRAELL